MVEARDPLRSGRYAKLIQLVWPGGIPAREGAFLRSLSPDDLEVVARRLNAVWRAEQGEQPLEWLAQFAGVSRARFYVLRKAWAKGDLPALLRQQTRKPSAKVEKSPLIEASIQYLRDNGPNERNRAIARTLIADGVLGEPEEEPSVTQIQKLDRYIRVARRLMQTDADFLMTHYGRGLLIDVVGTDIVLDLEEPRPAVIALIIETASGVVLGAGIGPSEDQFLIQTDAVKQALKFVSFYRYDRKLWDGDKPELYWAVTPTIELGYSVEVLKRVSGKVAITNSGGYARGLQADQLLGSKLGRVNLAPRRLDDRPAGGKILPGNTMQIDRAAALLDSAVAEHNRERLSVLFQVEDSRDIGLTHEGSMVWVLKTVYNEIIDAPDFRSKYGVWQALHHPHEYMAVDQDGHLL